MTPARAFSAWAVQMLWVAFSRRMCCSRACSVSTNPRLPSASRVSPAVRAGIFRVERPGGPVDPAGQLAGGALGRREEPKRRAPEVEPVAERLALSHGDVDAVLAGRLEDAERHRVDGAHDHRTGAPGG